MLNSLLQFLRLRAKDYPTEFGQRIYYAAKSCLGTDASPNDLAPDELGCAETVTNVIARAGLSTPILLSTAELYQYLKNSPAWAPVNTPLAGDVIISPTGMGGANGITNGHTGIIMANGQNGVIIASNSSATGKFEENYTLITWRKRYVLTGFYPAFLYRRITN